MAASDPACEFCTGDGGRVLWRDGFCRVVRVDDPDYPGFCRVIVDRHVREITDLTAEERLRLMEVVFGVEAAVREVMEPHKMNVASLGNMTPHVHWHVIPRWADDRHFPKPVWAEPSRSPVATPERERRAERLAARLARLPGAR